jgi:hypothetical protein
MLIGSFLMQKCAGQILLQMLVIKTKGLHMLG